MKIPAPQSQPPSAAARKQWNKQFKVPLILCVIIAVVLAAVVIWSYAASNKACNAIRSDGHLVTAQVIRIIPLRKPILSYRAESLVPTDIAHAIALNVDVTYTAADGVSHATTIATEYSDPTYTNELYQQASSGSLQIKYLPSDPKVARPAFETQPGMPSNLCSL